MNAKTLFPLLALSLPLALPAAAQELRLTLDDSVKAALATSNTLKAARLEAEAARAHEASVRAGLLPRLAADGSYRYVAELPNLALPIGPGGRPLSIAFGDYNNYSLGLSATWDLFSLPATWSQWQAAARQADAKDADAAFQQEALALRTRLAYFQTQLAATQVRLYADALKLAQSQADDLALRLKAGTSSRIDALSASNEELDRRAAFRLAQVDLAGALRELFALTGEHLDADVSIPVEDSSGQSLPAKVAQPTLAVALDEAPALLAEMAAAEKAPFKATDTPRLRALLAQVEAARRQASAAFSGHLPSGSVGFRFSHDYPETPLLQAVDQKTTSANVSLPLFSFGQVSDRVEEQDKLAQAAQGRADAAATEVGRDWQKSRDRLAGLRDQRDLETLAAQQAASLQELVYKSYKIGGSTFLEVQSSSLKSLQAGLALATTETQMLIELANLSALTDGARP